MISCSLRSWIRLCWRGTRWSGINSPMAKSPFFLVIAFSSSGYARIRESVTVADVPYYTKYDPVNSAAWDAILEMSLYGRDSPLSLRSERRRVGQEGGRTVRLGWVPDL